MNMSIIMGVVTSMGMTMSTAHGMCTDVCALRACMSMNMRASCRVSKNMNSNKGTNTSTCMSMGKDSDIGKCSTIGKVRAA
jgi:hypothetical protein